MDGVSSVQPAAVSTDCFFTVSATTPRTGIVTTHMFHHSNKIVQL